MLDLFSERKAVTAWDPVEGESHLDTLLRAIVISRLGRAGDQVPLKLKSFITILLQEIRAEAKRRFDAHCSGGASISPDIRFKHS